MVIAIPTLVGGDALRECLESLTLQTFRNFQVVVVDNSGRGAVKKGGDAERAGAIVLELTRNLGFGAAINEAWERYPAAHLATLNDDTVAAPAWLSALMMALAKYPEAGMFTPCVVLAGSGTLDSAGMLVCADGSSKQRGHGEPAAQFASAEEALCPSGSAALYRREMIRDCGAFDPDFFLYCEDTDLGLRGRHMGWNCRYVPEARVSHRYSHSAGRASALKAYYVERNRLFLVVKNFPLFAMLWAPAVSLIRYAWHVIYLFLGRGAAAQFAGESGGGWRLPWFVLKAHMALIAHLPGLLRKRAKIMQTAKLPPSEFRTLLRRYSISPKRIAGY